jgi:CheY-like chemotaxis protein
MTAEQVERIFDEYSRFNMDSNYMTEGTGLGMSITQNLVNMMNGKIEINSIPGEGSVFTVTVLQRTTDGGVIGKNAAERLKDFNYSVGVRPDRIQISREYMPYGSVLVVDDIRTNLYVAKNLLAPYGLKVDTALSGFEALDMVRGGAVYDIIFMDHMMPKMDGIKTAHLLREAGYTRPIVVLTANAVAGQAEIFRKNGFDDFISKPIDKKNLDDVLNNYIRDRRGRGSRYD